MSKRKKGIRAGLCYGDIISLSCQDEANRGFVVSEGCYDESVNLLSKEKVLSGESEFRECLFRVCPMMHYTARSEMHDELKHIALGYQSNALGHLKDLVAHEALTNKVEFERRLGEPVRYGQSVQLQHILSQKFITMFKTEVAPIESSCLKVSLTEVASSLSWLTVLPRFKVRDPGDPVEVSDIVMFEFKGHGRGEWLHANAHGEVNCAPSTLPSSFQPNLFVAYDKKEEKYLPMGTVVQILHPSTQSQLVCLEQSNRSKLNQSKSNNQADKITNEKVDNPKKKKVNPSQRHLLTSESGKTQIENLAEVVLQDTSVSSMHIESGSFVDPSSSINSNSLWILENSYITTGGVANWHGSYRFRHLNSGKYLTTKTSVKSALLSKEQTGKEVDVTTVPKASSEKPSRSSPLKPTLYPVDTNLEKLSLTSALGTSFQFVTSHRPLGVEGDESEEIEVTDEAIENKTALYIRRIDECDASRSQTSSRPTTPIGIITPKSIVGGWITSGEQLEVDDIDVCDVKTSQTQSHEDAFVLSRLPPEQQDWLEDVKFGVSAAAKLSNILDVTLAPKKNRKGELTYNAINMKSVRIEVTGHLLSLIHFCTTYNDTETQRGDANDFDSLAILTGLSDETEGRLHSGHSAQAHMEKIMKYRHHSVNTTRQILLREQGVVAKLAELTDVIARALKAELRTGNKGNFSRKKRNRSSHSMSSANMQRIAQLRKIGKCVYYVLESTFSQNTSNQCYTAQWFEQMVKHMNLNIGSAKCLTNLVDENKYLLTHIVNKSHIELFVKLIQQRGMKSDYLQFLTALCLWNGEPVQSNQNFVCSILLGKNPHLLIHTSFDTNNSREIGIGVTADDVQKFMQNGGGGCDAYDLTSTDYDVSISWECPSVPESNPINLFKGLKKVPLETFCSEKNLKLKGDVGNRRREMFVYYYHQVKLMVALCKDRNYLAVHFIEKILPYRLILSIISNDSVPEGLRAVYISPQRAYQLPRLTRMWAENDRKIPSCPKSNRFAVLQAVLEKYFINVDYSMKADQMDANELTRTAADVVVALVSFGFYAKMESLYALREPMILLIDGRNDIMDENEHISPYQVSVASSIIHDSDAAPLKSPDSSPRHQSSITISKSLSNGSPEEEFDKGSSSDVSVEKTSVKIPRGKKNKVVPEGITNLEEEEKKKQPEADEEEEKKVAMLIENRPHFFLDLKTKFHLQNVHLEDISFRKSKVEETLDGIPYTTWIILMTILSVIQSIWSLVVEKDASSAIKDFLEYSDYFFLALFSFDVIIRSWAMGMNKYLLDWMCLIDLGIIVVDWFSLVFTTLPRSAAAVFKVARMMRLLRLLRLIRLSKTIKQRLYESSSQYKVEEAAVVTSKRYMKTSRNIKVIECKLHVLQLLKVINNFRDELVLGCIIHKIKTICNDVNNFSVVRAVMDIAGVDEAGYALRSNAKDALSSSGDSHANDECVFKKVEYIKDDDHLPIIAASKSLLLGGDDAYTGLIVQTKEEDIEVARVLVDLCMYDHTPLVELSVSMLVGQFTNRERVLRVASNVTILDGRRTVHFQHLQSILYKLHNVIEEFEIWPKMGPKKGIESMKNMLGWIGELEAACWKYQLHTKDSELIPNEDRINMFEPGGGRQPDELMQNALVDAGCIELVEEVLLLPIDKEAIKALLGAEANGQNIDSLFGDVYQSDSTTASPRVRMARGRYGRKGRLNGDVVQSSNLDDVPYDAKKQKLVVDATSLQVCRAMNMFTCALASENRNIQKQLFRFLDDYLNRLEVLPSSSAPIKAILKNNVELCKLVPMRMLIASAEMISDNNLREPQFLDLLSIIMTADDVPIKDNQMQVIEIISHHSRSDEIMKLSTSKDSQGYANRVKAMTSPNWKKNSMLMYHVRLVNLFSRACFGEVNLCEVKCQLLYPFEDLIYAVFDKFTIWNVKVPLLQLFYHSTLDCETRRRGLTNSRSLSRLIRLYASLLKVYVDLGAASILDHMTELHKGAAGVKSRGDINNGNFTEDLPRIDHENLLHLYDTQHLVNSKFATYLSCDIQRLTILVRILNIHVLPSLTQICERFKSDLIESPVDTIKSLGKCWSLVSDLSQFLDRATEIGSKSVKNDAVLEFARTIGSCRLAFDKITNILLASSTHGVVVKVPQVPDIDKDLEEMKKYSHDDEDDFSENDIGCQHRCGFFGTETEVSAHEGTCTTKNGKRMLFSVPIPIKNKDTLQLEVFEGDNIKDIISKFCDEHDLPQKDYFEEINKKVTEQKQRVAVLPAKEMKVETKYETIGDTKNNMADQGSSISSRSEQQTIDAIQLRCFWATTEEIKDALRACNDHPRHAEDLLKKKRSISDAKQKDVSDSKSSTVNVHPMVATLKKQIQSSLVNGSLRLLADEEFKVLSNFLVQAPKDSDIQLANVLYRMVVHIRSEIKVDPGSGLTSLSTHSIEVTSEALGLLYSICHINEIHEDNERLQLELTHLLREQLVNVGALHMCLELCSNGISRKIQVQAMSLANMLMTGVGRVGLICREEANKFLLGPTGSSLFLGLQSHINFSVELAQEARNRHLSLELSTIDESSKSSTVESEAPDSWSIQSLLLVQNLTQGHYKPNQELMTEQGNSTTSVNILSCLVNYMAVLSKGVGNLDINSMDLTIKVILTLTEAAQGPCMKNQLYLACDSNVLDSCKRILSILWHESHQIEQKNMLKEHEEETSTRSWCRTFCNSLNSLSHKIFGTGESKSARLQRHEEEFERQEDIFEEKFSDICGNLELNVLTLILSLLEGHTESKIHDAIFVSLDVDKLAKRLDTILNTAFQGENDIWSSGHNISIPKHGSTLAELLLTLEERKPLSFRSVVGTEYNGALVWSRQYLKTIEVMWLDSLHRVFFREPEIYQRVDKNSYLSLDTDVDRTNSDTKLNSIMLIFENLYREMVHEQWLVEHKLEYILSGDMLFYAKQFSYTLAVVINLILLVFYSYEHSDNFEYGKPGLSASGTFWRGSIDDSSIDTLVKTLGLLQVFFSSFIFVQFIAVKVPPAYAKFQNPVLVCLNTLVIYYAFYTITALMGVFLHQMWFSLHLMDIIIRDATTRQVVNSIIYPIKSLAMTGLLGGFVVYIFAMVLFVNFPADFDHFECRQLWTCFATVLNWGIRNGGGVGESMHEWNFLFHPEEWLVRNVIYNFLFFCVVNVILLNILFGIIIDTFADLRNQKELMEEDAANYCSICNINREKFERAKIDFSRHKKRDHNIWNYFRYIVYLQEKDPLDHTGVEAHVYQCMQNEDNDWFPVQRCKAFESIDENDDPEEEENALEDLFEALEDQLDPLEIKLDKLQRTVRDLQSSGSGDSGDGGSAGGTDDNDSRADTPMTPGKQSPKRPTQTSGTTSTKTKVSPKALTSASAKVSSVVKKPTAKETHATSESPPISSASSVISEVTSEDTPPSETKSPTPISTEQKQGDIPNDITATKKLDVIVKSGYVDVQQTMRWKNRYLLLTEAELIIATTKEDAEAKYRSDNKVRKRKSLFKKKETVISSSIKNIRCKYSSGRYKGRQFEVIMDGNKKNIRMKTKEDASSWSAAIEKTRIDALKADR